jgi:hypothetical protein
VRICRSPNVARSSLKVASGRSSTSATINAACCSNGDVLPPRGFAAALPVLRTRCSHPADPDQSFRSIPIRVAWVHECAVGCIC